MADPVTVAKSVEYAILGVPADNISITKVVAYVILEAIPDGSTPPRQAHVFAQKITRPE